MSSSSPFASCLSRVRFSGKDRSSEWEKTRDVAYGQFHGWEPGAELVLGRKATALRY